MVAWITTIFSFLSKAGPVLSWILQLFPQTDILKKIMDIINKISANPNYPIVNLLQDIADLFSNAVTPQPMPPGMAAATGGPLFHEVFSCSECTKAYHMLPDDVKQKTIETCGKLAKDPQMVGSIAWPVITSIWTMFGPLAQKIIDLFLASWLNKRTAAIAAIQKQAALPAAPPAVAP